MSTIIRDAVIRLKLEQQKTKLETPEIKAVKEYGLAHKEAGEIIQRSYKEAERATVTANHQMVSSFREGGEGALRMARGIAFLSAGGSEDMKKLVQQVALAQGAFDVFAGSAKM